MNNNVNNILRLLKYSKREEGTTIEYLLGKISNKYVENNYQDNERINNLIKMILDIYETFLEMNVASEQIKNTKNNEIEFNYHLKNYHIRTSAIIDGCVELINLYYNFNLEKNNCTIGNINKKLKFKKINSKSFKLLRNFNKNIYTSIVEKNNIIHRCDLKGDYLTISHLIARDSLSDNFQEQFNKNMDNVFDEINKILKNNLKIISDFLFEFFNDFLKESKLIL